MSDGPVTARRGLRWWGWLLVGIGAALVILTAVLYGRAIAAITLPGPIADGGAPIPAAPVPDEPDGVAYTSAEFGYEVQFPGEPEETRIDQSVAGYDLVLVAVQWYGGDGGFSVNATEFPADLVTPESLDAILEGSMDGAAQNVVGTVVDEEFVEFAGERALTAEIRASGISLYAHVFFRDGVQFTIVSQGGTRAEHDDRAATFRFTG